MRAFLKNLMGLNPFSRNVAVLTVGTAFAQGLMVLVLPVLTRLYTPQDFNLLAVYTSVLSLAAAVSCLRYEIAVPIPEDDVDALSILIASLVFATIISFIFSLAVIFFPHISVSLIGEPALQPYLWMIPLGILIASFYNALQYWASRKTRFVLITKTRVTRAFGGAGSQLILGLLSPSPFGLLLGYMVYGGLGIVGLVKAMYAKDWASISRLDLGRIIAQVHKYRRFPFFSVPETLFNTAGIHVPVLLIAAHSGGPEAAFLMLAMRVIGLPMGLIGSSVAQVYLSEAPSRLRDGTLGAFTRHKMWVLFKSSTPPLLGAGLLSPWLFPIVFGSDWASAGWLVLWMTPWHVAQFVTSPVSMILNITQRQHISMITNMVGCIIRLATVVVALQVAPAYASESYAISGLIFYVSYLLVIWRVTIQIKQKKTT